MQDLIKQLKLEVETVQQAKGVNRNYRDGLHAGLRRAISIICERETGHDFSNWDNVTDSLVLNSCVVCGASNPQLYGLIDGVAYKWDETKRNLVKVEGSK